MQTGFHELCGAFSFHSLPCACIEGYGILFRSREGQCLSMKRSTGDMNRSMAFFFGRFSCLVTGASHSIVFLRHIHTPFLHSYPSISVLLLASVLYFHMCLAMYAFRLRFSSWERDPLLDIVHGGR